MPQKTRYQSKPKITPKKAGQETETNFFETLSATMPYRQWEMANPAVEGTPLWAYPAWVAGSIVLGVLIGLAIKDFQTAPAIIASPGTVARVADPQYTVASTALQISKTSSQVIQGDSGSVQGSSSDLQAGRSITSYQNGFSAYGQQGSVNIPAARH